MNTHLVKTIKSLCLLLMAALLVLTGSVAQADVSGEAVEYSHNGVALQGYLALDKGDQQRRPGVLLVHEWWGHNDYIKERARQYAALGYVAFALDMYGKGVLTSDPKEAGRLSKPFYDDRGLFRARVREGMKQLEKHALVDPARIAVLGYCFGGTGALELARSGAQLRAAISFHGGLGTPSPAAPAGIHAKILVLNGAEDPMVSAQERVLFMNEMRSAGADWQFVEFGGAVHAFSNPGADGYRIPGVAYNASANARSFEMSKDFLAETLK